MANYMDTIKDQTARSLWSLNNVMNAIPDEYWEKKYCEMPLWKHVYHTLYSLDKSYINPMSFEEPDFHVMDLNNLDVQTKGILSRELLKDYFLRIKKKINEYLNNLTDEKLLQKPEGCPHTRFRLILGQHRHLDMHIGMMMGYIISGKGLWPRIITPHEEFPSKEIYTRYF